MSTLFAVLLTAHIILGVVGLIANYATLIALLKKSASKTFLVASATIAAVSYVLSWLAGGYYYVLYYGDTVKPLIKEGVYPWAHLIFMEWKEHVFLMLPPAAVVLALVIWLSQRSESDARLSRSLVFLTATITVLATLITLSGIIISGGAR